MGIAVGPSPNGEQTIRCAKSACQSDPSPNGEQTIRCAKSACQSDPSPNGEQTTRRAKSACQSNPSPKRRTDDPSCHIGSYLIPTEPPQAKTRTIVAIHPVFHTEQVRLR
jgi:hypothetical protein